MRGTFSVKNVSGKTLTIERLAVDIQDGATTQDLDGFSNITLAAGASYSFSDSRILTRTGSYTAIPAAKVGGKWIAIKNRNTVTFKVYPRLPVPKCDFNGDGRGDITILYDYSNSNCRWHVWLSDGSKLNISNAYNGWWKNSGSYTASQVVHALYGDFNGDGKTDITALYDYGNHNCRWHVWLSDGTKFNISNGSNGWWMNSGSYTATAVAQAVSGDFNCDGKTDIAALYNYGGTASRWHVWLSDGTKFNISNGSNGWWKVDSGYDASKVVRAVSGDFNKDGKGDIAALYNYGSGKVRWHVWTSTGSSFTYSGSSGWWAVDNYTATGIKDAVPGDFNADGRADIAVLYNYGGGKSRWHVWLSSGSSFLYQGSSGWWAVDSGYNGDKVVGITCGDFNKDTKTDVAALYDYGSGNVRWHVWASTGSGFSYSGSTGWWQGAGYTPGRVRHILP